MESQQKNVPSPAAKLCVMGIFDLGPKLKLIPVLIRSFRLFIVQINDLQPEVIECMQLARF